MTLAPSDASGVAYMMFFLENAELLGSSKSMTRESIVAEYDVERSYTRSYSPNYSGGHPRAASTAVSDSAPILIGKPRAEDAIIAELADYVELTSGWDGYDAAKPSALSIRSARRFVRAAAGLGLDIVPSLHADGTVLLDINDDGTMRFMEDGRIVYSFTTGQRGIVEFDGHAIPGELRNILSA